MERTFPKRLPQCECSNGNIISKWIMPVFKKKKCSERISGKISQRTWNVRLKFHSHWLSRLQFTQGMSQTTHCLKCPGFTLDLHRQAVICNQTSLLCLCFWGLGLEHGLFLQNERWMLHGYYREKYNLKNIFLFFNYGRLKSSLGSHSALVYTLYNLSAGLSEV